MNVDRDTLLPSYFPTDADWGIEESRPFRPRFGSTTTSEFSQHGPLKSLYHYSSASLTQDGGDSQFGASIKRQPTQAPSHIHSTTANFSKFIRKYLALGHESAQLREKFNYNLVVSNLLDDTLILSKNEQALASLMLMRDLVDKPMCYRLTKEFDCDNTELQILNIKYRLEYRSAYKNPFLIVILVRLAIYLLRQSVLPSPSLSLPSRVRIFKVLLIVASKVVKFKRAEALIYSAKTLRSLDDFMLSNCKINKDIISSIITLKEFQMFTFLDKPHNDEKRAGYYKDLFLHLNTTLRLLVLNMKHSVVALLPYSNGDILEKYCLINNVQIGTAFSDVGNIPEEEEEASLEKLTSTLNHFNNLRRFFICQLLTIHDPPLHNFFVSKICDSFAPITKVPNDITMLGKLKTLQRIFNDHTRALDQLHSLNDKFRYLFSPSQATDFANDNVLLPSSTTFKQQESSDDVFANETEINLDNLINKLQSMTTSLKYFKKYNRSISAVDDPQEHDEKLSIFRLFSNELENCTDIYHICMKDYENDFSSRFARPCSTTPCDSNSQRNSYSKDDQFSLKSFRTSSSSKRRSSLNASEPNQASKVQQSKPPDKKNKRPSAGLQLGLLTVFEEPNNSRRRIDRSVSLPSESINKPSSYYDHYTSPSAHTESYNQATLEVLTRKVNTQNPLNRYSMLSVNSNVSGLSDLIASTHMTTDDDIDHSKSSILGNAKTEGLSKEELQAKLEESLCRIYNLEHEKKEFVDARTPGESIQNEEDISQIFTPTSVENFEFLNNLERTLNSRNMS